VLLKKFLMCVYIITCCIFSLVLCFIYCNYISN
jgi:hypothetical protein